MQRSEIPCERVLRIWTSFEGLFSADPDPEGFNQELIEACLKTIGGRPVVAWDVPNPQIVDLKRLVETARLFHATVSLNLVADFDRGIDWEYSKSLATHPLLSDVKLMFRLSPGKTVTPDVSPWDRLVFLKQWASKLREFRANIGTWCCFEEIYGSTNPDSTAESIASVVLTLRNSGFDMIAMDVTRVLGACESEQDRRIILATLGEEDRPADRFARN
ncbi:MAG: hypothetical protein U1D30_07155 [Planctomycetota bacterium]